MKDGYQIIGIGNDQRGDDAAGLIAARRLAAAGLPAIECHGDLINLLDLWAGTPEVILIDAVQTGRAAGEIVCLDATKDRLPVERPVGSTHSLGLAEVIELARTISCLPAKLTLFGIESREFRRGAAPTREVLEAVEEVARRIEAQFAAKGGAAALLP